MKLLHMQILAAAAFVGFAGAALGLLNVIAERDELKQRLEASQAAAKSASSKRSLFAPRQPARETTQEVAELAGRVRALENENAALKRELAALTRASEGSSPGQPASTKVVPTAGMPSAPLAAPPPQSPPAAAPPYAPPPAPEPAAPGEGGNWGAAEDGEMDEMAAVLKLDAAQREEVKRIIVDGQNEFERRLNEAGQRGERDISVIERIGEEISKRTQERIDQILYPEQKQLFRDFLTKKEQGR